MKENIHYRDNFHRKKRKVYNDYAPTRDGIFSIDDNYLMNFEGKKYNPLLNEGLKIHQDTADNWNFNNDIDETNDDGFWYNQRVHPYYEYDLTPQQKHSSNNAVFKADDTMTNSGELFKKRFRSTVDNNNNNFNLGGYRRSFYFQ